MIKFKKNIRVIGGRVLVRVFESQEEKRESGIVILPSSEHKPQEGEVVAVGHGEVNQSDASKVVSVGDKVIFGEFAGDNVRMEDETGRFHTLKILYIDSILGYA